MDYHTIPDLQPLLSPVDYLTCKDKIRDQIRSHLKKSIIMLKLNNKIQKIWNVHKDIIIEEDV